MDFGKLDRGEVIAAVGGVLLAISLFLEWYTLGSPLTHLNSCNGPGGCSAWKALSIVRFLLLLVAIAPAVLAWIIVRGHALSWPRGELTAVAALTALVLVLFRGVIDKPGNPPGQISISFGWWLALLASLLILTGAISRSREASTRRKPPGVL